MATSNVFHQNFWPFPMVRYNFRPPSAAFNLRRHLPIPRPRKLELKAETVDRFKWAIKSKPKSRTLNMQHLVDFLYEDLPHVFNDQGIDKTAYDERIFFRDPITKYDNLSGYLFYIALTKTLFMPQFQLHWVKQTGPYEITTRWTVVMKFVLLPWKPELVLTGTSVMGVNPQNGKFCSHVDRWDSIEKNDYFSFEACWDIIKQMEIYKTLELETPKYQILKRTADYQVRQYHPFIVVETNGDTLSGSTGFIDVTGYIFGKNFTMDKLAMTTVFTQGIDDDLSKVSIQVVLPLDKEKESLPNPNKETVCLRKVEGGIVAVMTFSGNPTEAIVHEKEKTLRSNIIKDGLKPQLGCLLARYINDPGRTWSFIMVCPKACVSVVS